MARPARGLPLQLQVEYVPVPKEKVGAWRASLLLLTQLLHEEKKLYLEEQRNDQRRNDVFGSTDFSIAIDGDALVADRILQIDA